MQKKLWWLGVVLGLGLQAPPAAAQSASGQNAVLLEVPQLVALARSVETFKKDAFHTAPDHSALAGKRFRIELPIPEHQYVGWNYDAGHQRLTVAVESTGIYLHRDLPEPFAEADTSRFGNFLVAQEQTLKGQGYTGANAYGGMAEVRSQTVRQYGIVELSGGLTSSPRSFSMPIAPDDAQKLVANLRLRAEGVLMPIKGSAVVCFDHLREATFSLPEEEYRHICLISTYVNALSIIDARTGKILQDWQAPTR